MCLFLLLLSFFVFVFSNFSVTVTVKIINNYSNDNPSTNDVQTYQVWLTKMKKTKKTSELSLKIYKNNLQELNL